MTAYYVNPIRRVSLNQATPDGLTWDDAFVQISDACDAASSGDSINVMEGTIQIVAGFNEIEIPAGVSVYGGYPQEGGQTTTDKDYRDTYARRTIIDGQGTVPCIKTSGGFGAGAVLDGFYLVNGYQSGNNGAGVYLSGIASATIENCDFYNCQTPSYRGSAIYAVNCTTLTITNCQFGSCSGYSGPAIGVSATTAATVTNCKFMYNVAASDGGAIWATDPMTFVNCLFAHNYSGSNGGALYITDTTTVDLCTIVDNEADINGGGIYADATTTLVNSVVRDNVATTGAQVHDTATYVTQTYSNVEGGSTGSNGNIDTAPTWHKDGEHPYDQAGSTGNCDSANQGSSDYIATDILGRTRYDDPDTSNTGAGSPAYVDMGCYEFKGDEADYLDYSDFYLQLGQYGTSDTQGNYCLYTVLMVPPLPKRWADRGAEDKICKIDTMTEFMISETDTTYSEFFSAGGEHLARREAISVSPAHTDPTWEVDYVSHQSPDGTDMARMPMYPKAHTCRKFDRNDFHKAKPTYVIIEMRFKFVLDASTDYLDVFTAFFRPVMDDPDSERSSLEFHTSIHNAATATDRYVADMPISSYLVKEVLAESLLCIAYEARNPLSVPLFGRYSPNILVV